MLPYETEIDTLLERFSRLVLANDDSKVVCITGGPNSGKTTIIDQLRLRGITVVEEVATVLFHKYGLAFRQDIPAFQHGQLEGQLAAEIPVREAGGISLCDRGLFDSSGYLRVLGVPMPEEHRVRLNRIATLSKKPLYSVVFIFETVEQWNNDGIRDENVDFSKRLMKDMADAYSEFGEEVVRVPVFAGTREESIEQRLQLVIAEMAKRQLLI